MDDDHQSSLARAPASNPLGHPVCPWCKVPVDPNADTLELTKVKSTDNKSVTDRPVNGIRDTFAAAMAAAKVKKSKIVNKVSDEEKGQLQPIAASVLMRILYAARYARFDL